MILGGNGLSNGLTSSSSNNFPQLPQMPQLPFTDALNYPPPNSPAQPLPVPQSSPLTTPTGEDYRKVDYRSDRISAPGLLALPPLPQLPVVLPSKEQPLLGGSPSLSANLREAPGLSGPNRNQPLFDFPVPQNNPNNAATANNPNNADERINNFLNNNGLMRNGLYNNGLLNSGLNQGLNSGLNSGLNQGLNPSLNPSLNPGLNQGFNQGLSSNLVASSALPAFGSADK